MKGLNLFSCSCLCFVVVPCFCCPRVGSNIYFIRGKKLFLKGRVQRFNAVIFKHTFS